MYAGRPALFSTIDGSLGSCPASNATLRTRSEAHVASASEIFSNLDEAIGRPGHGTGAGPFPTSFQSTGGAVAATLNDRPLIIVTLPSCTGCAGSLRGNSSVGREPLGSTSSGTR